jgi:hypothetical protein
VGPRCYGIGYGYQVRSRSFLCCLGTRSQDHGARFQVMSFKRNTAEFVSHLDKVMSSRSTR